MLCSTLPQWALLAAYPRHCAACTCCITQSQQGNWCKGQMWINHQRWCT